MNTTDFQAYIWERGRELYRDMPWRRDTRPYYVVVSELMLQQTQVERVLPKFSQFITAFPDVAALAAAPLAEVLTVWSGLGYNRRAKFLHETARRVVADFNGVFPDTRDALVTLPGIGENTAGAVLAYSYNQPAVFIETNIRTVYFYHFFDDVDTVHDKEVRERVAQTCDTEHPREWYWALMDYGAFLKRQGVGRIAKSTHYKKQAPLKGSVREVRGDIIRVLTREDCTETVLRRAVVADERFPRALEGLIADGLVTKTKGTLHLTR